MDEQRQRLAATLKSLEAKLAKIYGQTYKDVLGIAQVRNAIENGSAFKWTENPAAEKALDQKLNALSRQVELVVNEGVKKAYGQASEQDAPPVGSYLGKTKQGRETLQEITNRATEKMREKGETAEKFYNDPQGGLTISGRVWRETDTNKKVLQDIIQSEIAQGHSADQATAGLKKYLLKEDEIPQMIQDPTTGQLVPNKAWNDYHPGPGVYKSPYKNALRLARTETNMAYRRAQIEQLQKNPLVVGYRIVTSGNHNGAPGEICECLAGDYPKTFIWTGWHPQCRCHIEPIMIDKKDFQERMGALRNGTLDQWKPKSTVTDLPQNYKEWLQDHMEGITASKQPPFFIRDNYTMKNGRLELSKQITELAQEVKQQQRFKENKDGQPIPSTMAAAGTPAIPPAKKKTLTDKETAEYLQRDMEERSEKQQKFIKDFEKQTGIKRTLPMTPAEALQMKKEGSQETNAAAYLLRRWGFQIEAKKAAKNALTKQVQAKGWPELFEAPGVQTYQAFMADAGIKRMTPLLYSVYLEKNTISSGIYAATFVDTTKGECTVILERLKTGQLVILNTNGDQETNLEKVLQNLAEDRKELKGKGIARIDDKTLKRKYYDIFKRRKNGNAGQ